MIDKRNPIAPDHFQYRIDQVFLVGTMIPLTQITCAIRVFGRRLHLNIIYTTFAFEAVIFGEFNSKMYLEDIFKRHLPLMSVTLGVFIQCEQIPELVDAEMPLHVFLIVHHATAQRLFVSLSLKYLFLHSARRKHSINL